MSLFSLDEVKALSEQSSPGNAAVPVKDIFAEKQRAGWHNRTHDNESARVHTGAVDMEEIHQRPKTDRHQGG